MKFLFKTFLILVLCWGNLSAQGLLIQGGLNNSKLHYNWWNNSESLSKVRQGFQFGLFKDFNLGKKFYFQTGLLVQSKGGKEVEDVSSEFTGIRAVTKSIDDIFSMGIPASVGKKFKFGNGNLFFQLGPKLNLNLFGKNYSELKTSTSFKQDSKKLRFGNNAEELKWYEISSIYQTGFEWQSFKAGLQYEHGHSNLFNSSPQSKMKTRVLSFVIGYTFKKKQKE